MSQQSDERAAARKREVPPDPEPNPSLKDEPCPGPDGKAYNEAKAKREFDDKFIDELMKDQPAFRGDWLHLARLVKCECEARKRPVDVENRFVEWNYWYSKCRERLHLEHANLRGLHLEYANMSFGHFEHADFTWAHLNHAEVVFAHLKHANLHDAHCEHANFTAAHFDHAVVNESNFNCADLRSTYKLRFDDNPVRDIRIEGDAPDPWSVLRRKYTGPWFFLHLLLLVIFFAPYTGRLVALTATSRAEEWLAARGPAIRQVIAERADADQVDEWLGLWDGAWDAAVEQADAHSERVMAWWVLIGGTKAWWLVPFGLIVLLYNLLRLALTLRVGILRDAEERSGVTPRLEEYMGAGAKPDLDKEEVHALGWLERFGLYRLHQIARVLLWFAFGSVVVNSVVWLSTTWVWVPK